VLEGVCAGDDDDDDDDDDNDEEQRNGMAFFVRAMLINC